MTNPPPIAKLAEVNPPATGGADDTSMLDRLGAKYALPKEPDAVENIPAETPPAEGSPPTPATPAVPPIKTEETPPAPNASAAARRVADKAAAGELDALKAKIAELEAKAAQLPDLETKYAETRTLAEQRAAELDEHKSRFKNETDVLDSSLVFEVPIVREAQERYNNVAVSLFPVDISNPAAGEPDLRFDPETLNQAQASTIQSMIERWEKEEFEGKGSPQRRSQVQHIILSNIAAAIGVDKESFQEVQVDGSPYNVIPTTHPVYQHLKASIRPFVNARRDLHAAQDKAKTSVMESGKTIVGNRVTNTKKMLSDTGFGLTGDSLKEALAKTPDNPYLKVMSLIDGDAELVAELKENIEAESATNGYFRPQLDLFETDLKTRNSAAQAHLSRIGRRVIQGALGPVLMKHALKQAIVIAAKDAEIAKLRDEAAKTLIQAEPGAISGQGETPTGGSSSTFSEVEKALARKHGLTL